MSDRSIRFADLKSEISNRSIGLLSAVLVSLTAFLFWDRMTFATGGTPTPPLDDTYIYLQYAKTFAQGDPYSWLPNGGYTTGATSMLYVPILAIFEGLGLQSAAMFTVAFCLGMTLWGLCLWMLGSLLQESFGKGPALIGLLAASGSGVALWNMYSGMDSALLLFVTLVAFKVCREACASNHLKRRVWLVLFLLVIARPEGAVFALFLSVWLGLSRRQISRAEGWAPLVGVLCLIVAMMLLHLALTGSMRTNGMATKSWLTDPTLSFAGSMAHVFTEMGSFLKSFLWPDGPGWHRALLLWLCIPAIVWCIVKRHTLGLLAALMVLGIGLSFQSSYANVHRNRYQSAYIPVLLAVGSAWFMWFTWNRHRYLKRILPAFFILFLAWSARADVDAWSWRYALDARDIIRHPVAMGHWIKAEIPEGAVVAVHDAGAMPYFSDHTRFLDLVGLGTNGMGRWYRSGPGSLFEKIESLPEEAKPDYYVIYPDWFENADLYHQEVVHSIRLRRWSIVPHHEKMVFKARKDVFGSGARLWHQAHQGLHILDAIDFADLDSETKHSFSFEGAKGPTSYVSGHSLGDEGLEGVLGDGARWIRGPSRFVFRDYSGEPEALVLRVASPDGGRLVVQVADQSQVEVQLSKDPKYREYRVDLRGAPKSEAIEVSIDPKLSSMVQIGHAFLVAVKSP